MNRDFFFEIHRGIPREGPGSFATTERAYKMLPELPKHPSILDVGCGPGTQTVQLAQLSGGHVTGLDNHQPFLDALAAKASKEVLADRVQVINASMSDIPLPDNSFDLIWAEGSIYIMGFEKGLTEWKRLLQPGGCVAVSEVSWLKPNPPEEIKAFWDENYPAIGSIEENLAKIAKCGYESIGHFTLPESDWLVTYYGPLTKRVADLRVKYPDNTEAQAMLDAEEAEVSLYKRYSDWYGYVFYVMRHI